MRTKRYSTMSKHIDPDTLAVPLFKEETSQEDIDYAKKAQRLKDYLRKKHIHAKIFKTSNRQ